MLRLTKLTGLCKPCQPQTSCRFITETPPGTSRKCVGRQDFETPVYRNQYSANTPQTKGKIYDKKPFRMSVKAGKTYSWCACGESKTQPLCDGSHRKLIRHAWEKKFQGKYPLFQPVHFTPKVDKDVWFCNCKQTSNRPFCDGTHKRAGIQSAVYD